MKTLSTTSTTHRQVILTAYKTNGEFTKEKFDTLRIKAHSTLPDGSGCMVSRAKDWFGNEVLLWIYVYKIEALSLYERIRHSLGVFFTAIARNVGVSHVIEIITHK